MDVCIKKRKEKRRRRAQQRAFSVVREVHAELVKLAAVLAADRAAPGRAAQRPVPTLSASQANTVPL